RPTKYDNIDWIKPGKASWSWWSDPASSSNFIPLKDYVDLSKEMGWKYSLVDADWDIMRNGNIDQLIEYANKQDVGLFVWYNSGGPNNKVMYSFVVDDVAKDKFKNENIPNTVIEKLEPIFYTYFFPEDEYTKKIMELLGNDFERFGKQIIETTRHRNARPRDRFYEKEAREKEFKNLSERGVQGIKVDFFASDKQEIIKLYLNIFKEAAKNKILVNTHGSTIPRGWSKTFPNLLSMESVMGAEMYGTDIWPELAPVQNAIYPFIRNIVGPMDYTPATFSTRKGGYPHITSNAHELALTVLYETGLLHVSENADSLRQMPKEIIDFLKDVPVVWDDIYFIDGYPGNFSVLARKSGDKYYVAGINALNSERKFYFKPDFLKDGNYTAHYFLDGEGKNSFKFKNETTNTDEEISLIMKPYGGFVIVFEKNNK
ncbi:MAG: glycoside hydrolase family 97 catalytic domain-containing protein, partial [Bacteroidales bacterium]|nr:glycoside hydrolase family 97 catalytic domain-containing protein [Bacteroidales bacterium]